MAIQRNVSVGGDFITDPGEYVVKVAELKTGASKAGKAMLTVTMSTHDGKDIKAYFVKELVFHMKALAILKESAGLPPTAPAEQLVGREVGILVEPGNPDMNGRIYMQIAGYGPAKDVVPEGGDFAPSVGYDQVPF